MCLERTIYIVRLNQTNDGQTHVYYYDLIYTPIILVAARWHLMYCNSMIEKSLCYIILWNHFSRM